ncbi:hypothetical protein [Listeria booriae]|uniref:Uncharacterized protein n=1 Tax=Listeria booriae TaxID=1552123 RepID=A0A842EPC9_9LIST|nr:hypothetical protein [Listeria booriae]MBC2239777.1 hypothetical protein [Listeria booriae]
MTQNEKDREFLDMCASNRENGWCIDTMGDEGDMLYEIANRLLAERENAETVYQYATKVEEPWSSEDNYYPKEQGLITTYSDGSHDFIHSTTTKKGIWIPVEEAE